ncbi:MAG: hypothetical protein HY927_00525 [Elusimicrobia bacterium]|nr:hypothetical protein [Elusimicrobiota bacterium]
MKSELDTTEHEKSMLMVGLVNRYMTPFAAILVLSGAALSPVPMKASAAACAILVLTWVMNNATHRLVARYPEKMTAIRDGRVVANYIIDLGLIWLFMPYWPSIWLLFLLTIIAIGAYEEKRTVIQHAALLTAMLFIVSYARGVGSLTHWGDVGVRCATLWFTGLFTNRLVASLR